MTLPCLARADRTGIPSFVLRLSFAHRCCPTSGRRTFTTRDESMRLGVNHLDRHRALPLITRLRLNLPPSLVVPPNSRYANYPGCFLSLSLSLSLLSASRRERDPPERRWSQGWLTPFANQLFGPSCRYFEAGESPTRRGPSAGRGASPRAANLKAYHGESDGRNEQRQEREGTWPVQRKDAVGRNEMEEKERVSERERERERKRERERAMLAGGQGGA